MRPDKNDEPTKSNPEQTLSTPYGPHPGHIDDASGGADSSPFETLSSDERDKLLRDRREGKNRGDEGEQSRP